MSLLPQVLTALGPPQPPRIKMVSLSITIWRGQRRVSAWEGFLARSKGRQRQVLRCMSIAGFCVPQDEERGWSRFCWAQDRAGCGAHPTPHPKPVPLTERSNRPSQSTKDPTFLCKGGDGGRIVWEGRCWQQFDQCCWWARSPRAPFPGLGEACSSTSHLSPAGCPGGTCHTLGITDHPRWGQLSQARWQP